MNSLEDSALRRIDHVEISIFFQLDSHPYENRWEIWTAKERDGERSSNKHEDNFRELIIVKSRKYIHAAPFTSVEETVILDFDLPYTLTVYDEGKDGLTENRFYQILKTEYTHNDNIDSNDSHDHDGDSISSDMGEHVDYEYNNDSNSGSSTAANEWIKHRSVLAKVSGKFAKNNHVLTVGSGKDLPQQHQDIPLHAVHSQQQQITMEVPKPKILYDVDNDQIGHISQFHVYHLFLVTFVFISTITIGLSIFVGFQMYRTRQRGVGVVARKLDIEDENYDNYHHCNDVENVRFIDSNNQSRFQPTQYRNLVDDVNENEGNNLSNNDNGNDEEVDGGDYSPFFEVSTCTGIDGNVPTYVTVNRNDEN